MPYSTSIIMLLEKLEPDLRKVFIAFLEEMEKQREEIKRQREEAVTKNEFNELKEIVKELAEAQKRTELRLNELAEAQRKTEEELRKLIGEHGKTREMLGSLQHTVGYILEDKAFLSLPALLKRDYGIEITHSLKRDYVAISPGKYLEINIIGKGKKDGQEVWILGECKSQIKKRDIDKFLKNLTQIERILPGEKVLLVVTYQTSPAVMNYIKEKGLKLYFSYEFRVWEIQ